MAIARTIFAALIAISVAMIPVNGGATIFTKPVEMSMADQMDMPCRPPSDRDKGAVACAFKCLSFVAAMFPPSVNLSDVDVGLPPSFTDGTLDGHVVPPTHPPPI